jgi:hypothetical protein
MSNDIKNKKAGQEKWLILDTRLSIVDARSGRP